MKCVFEAKNLCKRFSGQPALERVDLKLEGPAIIGLIGKNGCGKTTLIRHMIGQYLPSDGQALTLGRDAAELRHEELVRIGYVPQEISLLNWMTVEQHLDYIASFYPVWDKGRQDRLLTELELFPVSTVGSLSSGNLQKLAIIIAVCHHPEFLILDEPVSDLDPIVRGMLLEFLLELLREDEATLLISSHVLRDVEKVVDHIVCLDRARVIEDAALDDLKDVYSEWLVRSPDGRLPPVFDEPFVLAQEIDGHEARLVTCGGIGWLGEFKVTHGVEVSARPLNLEEMFPAMLARKK